MGPMWCIHNKFFVKTWTYLMGITWGLWRARAPQPNERSIIFLFVATCLLFKITFPLASHFPDGHFTLGTFWAPQTWTLGESLKSTLNSWTFALPRVQRGPHVGSLSWDPKLAKFGSLISQFDKLSSIAQATETFMFRVPMFTTSQDQFDKLYFTMSSTSCIRFS